MYLAQQVKKTIEAILFGSDSGGGMRMDRGLGPPPGKFKLIKFTKKVTKKVSPMENKIIIEKSKFLTVNIAYCLETNITGSRKDACTY